MKTLYEEVLYAERTRAIMYLFGHYFYFIYFRDKEWALQLLPHIFPQERLKQHLYLAAWEGYLAGDLYETLFFEPDIQELYRRGVLLQDSLEPGRKHSKDPDQGIAVHLALAFMHYDSFGFDHALFKLFWVSNAARHAAFVSFLGRSFISGSNTESNRLIRESRQAKGNLIHLWDWVLENRDDKKLFTRFGWWINLEKGIFDPRWLAARVRATLEKTGGELEWSYGLEESIVLLAKANPEDVLAIARLHILEAGMRGRKGIPLRIEEWFDAFEVLHANEPTRAQTIVLINELIQEGGSAFWKFKEALP